MQLCSMLTCTSCQTFCCCVDASAVYACCMPSMSPVSFDASSWQRQCLFKHLQCFSPSTQETIVVSSVVMSATVRMCWFQASLLLSLSGASLQSIPFYKLAFADGPPAEGRANLVTNPVSISSRHTAAASQVSYFCCLHSTSPKSIASRAVSGSSKSKVESSSFAAFTFCSAARLQLTEGSCCLLHTSCGRQLTKLEPKGLQFVE